jgi:DNA-binding MarR family transcriptional regulator
MRLAQAARASRSRSGALLSRIGLHAGQEAVLKALDIKDGQAMSQLAVSLAVQPPTVTKMVTRLAAQGYLERRVAPDDGRQIRVFLTDLGRTRVLEVDTVIRQVEREALAGLPERERRKLRQLLRQVERNLHGPEEAVEEELEEA